MDRKSRVVLYEYTGETKRVVEGPREGKVPEVQSVRETENDGRGNYKY